MLSARARQVSLGLGKSWNLEAGAGTVKVGMWVLEMLFSYSGKTWKQSLEAGDSV